MIGENIEQFTQDIHDRIDYFRREYRMTYAEAIGCLEMIKMDLYDEAKESHGP